LRIPPTPPGNRYADYEIWIRNYAKTVENLYGDIMGIGDNTGNTIDWGAFAWFKGEAISRIDILRGTSVTTLSGSYALYGLGTAQ